MNYYSIMSVGKSSNWTEIFEVLTNQLVCFEFLNDSDFKIAIIDAYKHDAFQHMLKIPFDQKIYRQ